MDLKRVAKDTAKVLASYMTYQALRTVVNQLRETDPPRALWLQSFSSQQSIQDGDAYLEELLQAKPELALRIMTVRQHIADEVAEFLPEMVCTTIQQSNIEHRRQHLERITQFTLPDNPTNSEQKTDSDT
ncbi:MULTISPECIES: chaperonin family protein RbcX [Moorena]|uniref:RuBisCO chaperone RbcX n=1 Tax=Moorena producens 3L TaxID=489825 RepID=F4XYB6_9CYAN|nr:MULTISPECIES: chaperonin family protein RbcX [Moorena]EGJ30329.1 RbcX protein [Moorena producens 3L]NEP65651.1 RbcX chaperonin protein [Moorena sp. SIO3A5]OLT67648.1 RbcX chaperonin protein [Moorena producens 3L]